jgi:hypothetical protein
MKDQNLHSRKGGDDPFPGDEEIKKNSPRAFRNFNVAMLTKSPRD